ncbi:MAG: hypothetical protein LBB98_12635 [Treponema sp.]|jgi:hypothetical protein|nr:hypothetical protein [Treponema sp.]
MDVGLKKPLLWKCTAKSKGGEEIPYLHTTGRWVYLTAVLDLHDRKVIAGS